MQQENGREELALAESLRFHKAFMASNQGPFPATRWSIVVAVREGGDATRSRLALDELCKIYWRPIYGYARHQGLAPADAEDLTQSFFAFVLEKDLSLLGGNCLCVYRVPKGPERREREK